MPEMLKCEKLRNTEVQELQKLRNVEMQERQTCRFTRNAEMQECKTCTNAREMWTHTKRNVDAYGHMSKLINAEMENRANH